MENNPNEIIEKNNSIKEKGKEDNDVSCEEYEEEDIEYEDDNLVSNEELDILNKHFEFQVVREGEENKGKDEDCEMIDCDEEKIIAQEYQGFNTDGEIYSIAVNDKGTLVIGDGEDTTYFFDLNKKEIIKKEKINKDSVVSVAYSSDYKYLVTACLDGTVNIYDGDSLQLLNTVNGSYSDINVKYK